MEISGLDTTVVNILSEARAYKARYITELLGAIDYVGVFPGSAVEQSAYVADLTRRSAVIVYSDDDGDLYRLERGIPTDQGNIHFVKICHVPSRYNPGGKKTGYADYQTDIYPQLKKSYEHTPGFTMMYGDGWEILCLAGPEERVSVYIPDRPLTADLKIPDH